MTNLRGITIEGDWLGNNVKIDNMFHALCAISPSLLKEFIININTIRKLNKKVKITEFGFLEENVLSVGFTNKVVSGNCYIVFKKRGEKLMPLNSELLLDSEIVLPQKIQEEITQEAEAVEENYIEEVEENIVETDSQLPESENNIDEVDTNEAIESSETICEEVDETDVETATEIDSECVQEEIQENIEIAEDNVPKEIISETEEKIEEINENIVENDMETESVEAEPTALDGEILGALKNVLKNQLNPEESSSVNKVDNIEKTCTKNAELESFEEHNDPSEEKVVLTEETSEKIAEESLSPVKEAKEVSEELQNEPIQKDNSSEIKDETLEKALEDVSEEIIDNIDNTKTDIEENEKEAENAQLDTIVKNMEENLEEDINEVSTDEDELSCEEEISDEDICYEMYEEEMNENDEEIESLLGDFYTNSKPETNFDYAQIADIKDMLKKLIPEEKEETTPEIEEESYENMTLKEILAKFKKKTPSLSDYASGFTVINDGERAEANVLNNELFVAGDKLYKWGETLYLDE